MNMSATSISMVLDSSSILPTCTSKKWLVNYFRRRDGSCSRNKLGAIYFTDKKLEALGWTREVYKKKRDFDSDETKMIYEIFDIRHPLNE
jgi:hypothetical protein